MKPLIVILVFTGYFAFLLLISRITSRKADSASFFIGNRKSPWFIVAFGMIGASLSGVTFISVPGWVLTSEFAYMQMVLGYLIGYLLIILILNLASLLFQLTQGSAIFIRNLFLFEW